MTTICTDADGLIVMLSDGGSPIPPDGGALHELTPTEEETLKSLAAEPNGGLTYINGAFAALPYVPPPVIDMSDPDNLEKTMKAVLLAAATMSGKTVAQARSAFTAAWRSL